MGAGNFNPLGGVSQLFGGDGNASDNGGQAITDIGNNLASQTAVSPQSAAQTSASYGTGTDLVNQYMAQLQGGNAEQNFQNQGPLSAALYGQVAQQAQNPAAGWQNALAPELTQAQNQINEYYNARGLDNSGIAIGAMGTAGVDLAVQNAQNEMQYQQQSLSNAQSLSTNISGLQQQNLAGLGGLYENQQNAGLQSQSLANQGLEAASQIQTYPAQAQLGSYYGGVAAQQALPGQLIGAGGQLGGDMMLASAMCWVAAELFGGWNKPKTRAARAYMMNKSPMWFFNLYFKYGKRFAAFIKDKLFIKNMIRPLFEQFALLGRV